jgi:hypothetical protein
MKHRDRLSLFERLAISAGSHRSAEPAVCWTWTGSRCNKGYGHIRVAGVTMRVHIAAWELVKGRKVRRGYTLDHGCRNPACWRPSHMEEVTRAVNTARGNRANPRSTEKARAARRKGIEVVIHNTGMLQDTLAECAQKFKDAGPLFKL